MINPARNHEQINVRVDGLNKTFVMHLRGGIALPAVDNLSFSLSAGECAVLSGPSGAGKSSVLKMIHGSYRADGGSIVLQNRSTAIDIVQATPREILWLRNHVIGYVSQFLRVIPRVPTIDIVSAACQCDGPIATDQAAGLLTRLNIPERLWSIPPQTFSGGEQQRINIARGFASSRSILLLDEPTASLDAENRAVVVDMIEEKKRQGVAIIGIFHDEHVRSAVADRIVDIQPASQPSREYIDALSA
jgi:alpha-D-ribose 1-methylphosphonate 5-triphosphate synthase subunit PhnL